MDDKKAVILLDMSEGDTLLVGDSFYDAVGTEEANIAFIAAIYGFGSIEEVMGYWGIKSMRTIALERKNNAPKLNIPINAGRRKSSSVFFCSTK